MLTMVYDISAAYIIHMYFICRTIYSRQVDYEVYNSVMLI